MEDEGRGRGSSFGFCAERSIDHSSQSQKEKDSNLKCAG